MTDHADAGAAAEQDDDVIGEGAEPVDERSRMSFLDYLDELRRRIVSSLYALLVTFAVALYFSEDMFVFLMTYFGAFGGTLISSRPMGAFLFQMKISFLAALIVASPFLFAQLWLFVAPGLYKREKRIVIPFVVFSSSLFGAGAWFAHQVAFPAMWRFFASYDGLGGMKFFPNIDETFSLYVWVILGLGLVFQMPMLVFFLSRFGIVSAKFLIKHSKYAVLVIFVLAALITPSADPVTQLIFAAPMLVLYAISIGVAWMFGRRRAGDSESS